jgi:sterol 3beta-glucosyltransferase
MTQCIVDAVLESKIYCILSKGWSDRGNEKGDEVKDDLDGSDGVKYPPEI